MKIAYLVLAHNNYEHLKRLVSALNEGESKFYIHIDKKSTLPDLNGDNIIFLHDRIDVHWSGFSIVKATLKLLQRAIEDDNEYYALISGADYPVRPNNYLFDKLKEGGEYINIVKGCDAFNPLSRYKYYFFTDYYDRRDKRSFKTIFFLWLQTLLRNIRVQKKIPFQLYTGAQWFVLSKPCIKYILREVVQNKKYMIFFKTAFCPDECYFQTIIGNSVFYYSTKRNWTYADWNVDPGPAIISEKHIPILKDADNIFFARKFTNESGNVVGMIDNNLRINA